MAKASPIQPAYVSGEVSPLIRGRVDNERWASSLQTLENFIPLIQGPAQKRPGTRFIAQAMGASRLIDFQFNTEQAYVLEFGNEKMRVYKDRGLVLTGSTKTITGATSASPVVITAAAHGFSNGDPVFLDGVVGMTPINNRAFTVANVTANTFELSGVNGSAYPAYVSGGSVAKVFELETPYTTDQLADLRWTQSADTLWLFHPEVQPRVLTRTGDTAWTIEPFEMQDGPYLDENTTGTTLTPAETGHATPAMTANNAPSPVVVSATSGSSNVHALFNRILAGSGVSVAGGSSGEIRVDFGSGNAPVIDAYWITSVSDNTRYDDMFQQWTFQGSQDASTWVSLDSRDDEAGWSNTETRYYDFVNRTGYRYYRINFSGGGGSDGVDTDCAEIGLHRAASDQTPFNLTASSTTGINDGNGFQTTDVGRSIRLLGSDGRWRWAQITGRTSTTVVQIVMHGHALLDTSAISRWRMGRYSDTTGWPTTGTFFEDRLVIGGAGPEFYASQVGDYPNFGVTEFDGQTTTAATAINVPNLLSRQVNAVRWISTDERSLLIGTSGAEWVVRAANGNEAFSASNIQARPATYRGSYPTAAVNVERATLFLSADQRYLHEMAYVFEADGYRSPNLSWLAEHVTAESGIVEFVHAKSPQSILWAVREDGQLLGFSYEREQSVLAWHRHPMNGMTVERLCVIPGADGTSDLYLLVKRGSDRFICVMDALWTNSGQVEDSFFVDAGISYSGSAITTLSGLWHLEGTSVTGTADGEAFTKTVANGAITFSPAASDISAGIGYTSKLLTMPSNAGSTDGTAQGKTKRAHSVTFRLLNSRGGKYAVGPDGTKFDFNYQGKRDIYATNNLWTGDLNIAWPAKYEYDGVVYVEHSDPYPFTLIAHMPQIVTQDRG